MLFIVFTETYTHRNIFNKIGVSDYSCNGVDMILLNKDLSVKKINSNETDSFPENLNNVRLVFINDINLSNEGYILDILFQIIKAKKELYILFHENGKWNDQHKQILEIINGQQVYKKKDSHQPGSIYYEELAGIADAIEKNCDESFEKAIKELWNRFYLDSKRNFLKKIEKEDLISQIDSLTLPQVLQNKLIALDDWTMFQKKVIELRKLPDNEMETKLNETINRYFS